MNLRGLFGSTARQIIPFLGDESAPATSSPAAPATTTPGVGDRAAQPFMTPERRDRWAAKAYDVGAVLRGMEPTRVAEMEARADEQRKEAEERDRMARLQSLAQEIFPDNQRAQLLFALDPKAFGGALVDSLRPQTRESGKVYLDPLTGDRESMARIDRFDDRYGFVDPDTLQSGYGAPRDPTFAEQTGRMNAETSRDLGRGNLSVAQGRLGLERERFGREATAAGSGGDIGSMTTEQLLQLLRQ